MDNEKNDTYYLENFKRFKFFDRTYIWKNKRRNRI